MRAYRARRKVGRIVIEVPVEFDVEDLVEELEKERLLTRGRDHTTKEIKCAAKLMLARVADKEKFL
jgi:hypothetical protein